MACIEARAGKYMLNQADMSLQCSVSDTSHFYTFYVRFKLFLRDTRPGEKIKIKKRPPSPAVKF